ncbi:MAG: chromate transporter [Desulfurococcaceae archaeon]
MELFLEFLKVGFFTFGGGYGGLAVMQRELVETNGWISVDEFQRFVGIAQSSPGPIAISTSTLIGYHLRGIPGALLAVLGMVIPPYAVSLTIFLALTNYMGSWVVRAAFRGINAAVTALIFYVFVSFARSSLFKAGFDYLALIIFIAVALAMFFTKVSPIYLILASLLVSVAFAALNL